MGQADGREGARLPQDALSARQVGVRHHSAENASLDLLQVVRFGADFGLQEADVRLVASLLLRDRAGGEKRVQKQSESLNLKLQ